MLAVSLALEWIAPFCQGDWTEERQQLQSVPFPWRESHVKRVGLVTGR